jgi:hypothetical protein
MPQFVILHHQTPSDDGRGPHWDFMLEAGEVLRTWALAEPPDRGAVASITAEQLPDHRTAYLTYEGEVSGDRGEVAQYDAGTYRTIREDEDANVLEFQLNGQRCTGRVRLARDEVTQRWRFSFSPD